MARNRIVCKTKKCRIFKLFRFLWRIIILSQVPHGPPIQTDWSKKSGSLSFSRVTTLSLTGVASRALSVQRSRTYICRRCNINNVGREACCRQRQPGIVWRASTQLMKPSPCSWTAGACSSPCIFVYVVFSQGAHSLSIRFATSTPPPTHTISQLPPVVIFILQKLILSHSLHPSYCRSVSSLSLLPEGSCLGHSRLRCDALWTKLLYRGLVVL